jgi:hypothetical protein
VSRRPPFRNGNRIADGIPRTVGILIDDFDADLGVEDRFDIVTPTCLPALRQKYAAKMFGACEVGEQPACAERMKGRGVAPSADRSADDLEQFRLGHAKLLEAGCDFKFFCEDRHDHPC